MTASVEEIPDDGALYRLGCEREAEVRERKPDMSYAGFVASIAGAVRAIQTRAGHGFRVRHEPREGDDHAEISYRPAPGKQVSELEKNEKSELKLALRQKFGDLVPHTGS